jgi:hypothetical protein
MKLNWESGRQGTGYEKLKLFNRWKFFSRIKWDLYVLRYPVGSTIPRHRDPVPNHKHYRLNIYLWNAKAGGAPEHDGAFITNRFFTFFRPDLHAHSVSPVTQGTRYVLSFGFVRMNPEVQNEN